MQGWEEGDWRRERGDAWDMGVRGGEGEEGDTGVSVQVGGGNERGGGGEGMCAGGGGGGGGIQV